MFKILYKFLDAERLWNELRVHLFIFSNDEQALFAIIGADGEGEEVEPGLQTLEHTGLRNEAAT